MLTVTGFTSCQVHGVTDYPPSMDRTRTTGRECYSKGFIWHRLHVMSMFNAVCKIQIDLVVTCTILKYLIQTSAKISICWSDRDTQHYLSSWTNPLIEWHISGSACLPRAPNGWVMFLNSLSWLEDHKGQAWQLSEELPVSTFQQSICSLPRLLPTLSDEHIEDLLLAWQAIPRFSTPFPADAEARR